MCKKTKFTLETIDDPIVEAVKKQFDERSKLGQQKYGTTLDGNKLTILEWIEHAKQEAMDFVLYLEAIKNELNKQ